MPIDIGVVSKQQNLMGQTCEYMMNKLSILG